MKITVVYGTQRKGSTYHIAQQVLEQFKGAQVCELFLPNALPEFCVSCFRCFTEEKGVCAHSSYTVPIREKLLWADLIVLTSPVFSYHLSGQMKVFLDHFANMWMVHRPEKQMFHKQGIVISTAAGPVFSKTLHEMKDSLDFWGVAKTQKIGAALMETNWEKVSPKIKAKLAKKIAAVACRIKVHSGKTRPCLRVRKWFYLSRFMQKTKLNPVDAEYWNAQGWTAKARPWNP